jgi:Fe-Mn family superoxide dismutase
MPHEVPPLPYPYDGLEPYVDEQTMRLHHDRHHQAYVGKLNEALEGTELADVPVLDVIADLSRVPEEARPIVRNNGGGHYNHTLFWDSMAPQGGGEPEGGLGEAIASAFGSFDVFKDQFEQAGIDRFGSGWAWLVSAGGELRITSTPNQDSPVMDGEVPLLGNDVWEHAYYLTYQNRRPEYLRSWWNVVSWPTVAERFARAGG